MMKKKGFLAEHGIVRNEIKKDLLFFALPALVVFPAGLVASARDGYDGLVNTLWELIRDPENILLLSVPNAIGLAFCVVGLTIAFAAAFTLRRSYASTLIIRADQKLITHGIYRLVRHPVYFGVFIVVFSVPVYASSINGFLIMSVLIPIVFNRIRMEEKMMTDEFGALYRSYYKSTRKLIPFIY